MLENLKQFAITKEQQTTVFGGELCCGKTGGGSGGGQGGNGITGGGSGGGQGGDLTDNCDPNVEVC
ncbi:hypothetical protein EV195_10192 [Tenacibaculum skagerrakense]|uniref:Uncharacterized protein n=1 Tax=Tenacibaculum skagerrakense TaxID=186571 RepID=A0A4R2NZZ4_9FLAO|nr:hypothetical protein [Tenacibaculum skagerrakense]TCP27933.1 hypothetical protein EV195_10192 [Tenacibaculum skagerrakense]